MFRLRPPPRQSPRRPPNFCFACLVFPAAARLAAARVFRVAQAARSPRGHPCAVYNTTQVLRQYYRARRATHPCAHISRARLPKYTPSAPCLSIKNQSANPHSAPQTAPPRPPKAPKSRIPPRAPILSPPPRDVNRARAKPKDSAQARSRPMRRPPLKSIMRLNPTALALYPKRGRQ